MLIIVLFFRREIRQSLSKLLGRLKKADIAGNSFEFAEIKALKESLEEGTEALKDNPNELISFMKKQVEKLPTTNTSSKPLFPLSGRSILWVDDKPLNNVYEESIFTQLGATIKQATSTEQALHYLASDNYDLIISDLHRNENGRSNPTAGYDLLDEIRRQKIQVPLIFYTRARVNPEKARWANGEAANRSRLQDLILDIL